MSISCGVTYYAKCPYYVVFHIRRFLVAYQGLIMACAGALLRPASLSSSDIKPHMTWAVKATQLDPSGLSPTMRVLSFDNGCGVNAVFVDARNGAKDCHFEVQGLGILQAHHWGLPIQCHCNGIRVCMRVCVCVCVHACACVCVYANRRVPPKTSVPY